MTRIANLILSGVRDSAAALTADLQDSARKAGWPAAAANNLRVNAVGDDLTIEQGSEAEALEYGGLDTPPKPAVRKWLADEQDVARILLSKIEEKLKGVVL